ncbi:MAG: porin [Pseudomonadota bacterium]
MGGLGGYSADPLGNAVDRFSNALFYNSPVLNGIQVNATVGSRESAGAPAVVNPFSIATTYRNGPAALLFAYERNAALHTLKSVAGYVMVTPETKVMASLSYQDQGSTRPLNQDTKAWLVGANHTLGASKILAGYGQKQVDGLNKVKQISMGYEFSLSKRTYIYTDVSNKKGAPAVAPGSANSIKLYSLGVNHAF